MPVPAVVPGELRMHRMVDEQGVEAVGGVGLVAARGRGEDGAQLRAQLAHGVEVAVRGPPPEVRPVREQGPQAFEKEFTDQVKEMNDLKAKLGL